MQPRSRRCRRQHIGKLCAAIALSMTASQSLANPAAPMPLWQAAFPQRAALDGAVNPAIPLYADGSILIALLQAQWREYARDRMVPEMGRSMDLPPLPDTEDSERRDAFIPAFARHLLARPPAYRFEIDVQRSRIDGTPMVPDGMHNLRFDDAGRSLEQTLVSPTYSFQLDSRNAIGVSAVLAYQEFSTFGFGNVVLDDRPVALRMGERSLGTGVRLGMKSELAPGLSVGAALQSHIEMDPFYRYRGAYLEPGEFDIPASANLGLALDTTTNSTVSFDVRHIRYSDVKPFASSLLPNRFLALLGDGTSPAFDWQDLTVYEVGLSWQNDEKDLSWSVSWSSGRQPTPTSGTLARALAPDFADSHWILGVTQDTGDNSHFRLAASYTPSDYFLGLDGRGFEADSTLDRMELEARWSLDF